MRVIKLYIKHIKIYVHCFQSFHICFVFKYIMKRTFSELRCRKCGCWTCCCYFVWIEFPAGIESSRIRTKSIEDMESLSVCLSVCVEPSSPFFHPPHRAWWVIVFPTDRRGTNHRPSQQPPGLTNYTHPRKFSWPQLDISLCKCIGREWAFHWNRNKMVIIEPFSQCTLETKNW